METSEDPDCEGSSIVVLFLDSEEMWVRPSTNVLGRGQFVGFYANDRTSKGQLRLVPRADRVRLDLRSSCQTRGRVR